MFFTSREAAWSCRTVSLLLLLFLARRLVKKRELLLFGSWQLHYLSVQVTLADFVNFCTIHFTFQFIFITSRKVAWSCRSVGRKRKKERDLWILVNCNVASLFVLFKNLFANYNTLGPLVINIQHFFKSGCLNLKKISEFLNFLFCLNSNICLTKPRGWQFVKPGFTCFRL